MEAGWNEDARRIGAINRVSIREVNGFMYYQMNSVEPGQELMEMQEIAEDYWIEKKFLAALRLWDDFIKPSSIKQLTALQETRLDDLSDEELTKHIIRCHQAAKQMVFNHHQFTYSSFVPVGDFIIKVCNWTGKDPIDVLGILRGSDTNRLLFAREQSQAQEFIDGLRKSNDAMQLLARDDNDPRSAALALAKLEDIGGNIKQGLQFLKGYCDCRIVSGYDITYETFTERPDLLLKTLKSIWSDNAYANHTASNCEIKAIRDLVPAESRSLFDEMYSDARKMERLRDERGMFSDLWAIGILRCSFLQAGKRLFKAGLVDEPHLALDASSEELIALMAGIPVVASEELQQRADYRKRFSVTDIPAVLGEPQIKPTKTQNFPHPLSRIMAGLEMAINLAVEHLPGHNMQQGELVGIPASLGVVEGLARIIGSESEIKDISKGDILVVHQTTAAFTIVLPLISGIISEYGGILSHPAILAREYGIPCIVGCSGAIKKLHTGMFIRLDGTRGTVEVI